ncbi:MAG: hypothetical protein E3J72_01920 [Planctomycetota bacterium]|nr:MAG: hypothetical protein E3J72_01920 [Planctomycetota bacterium]
MHSSSTRALLLGVLLALIFWSADGCGGDSKRSVLYSPAGGGGGGTNMGGGGTGGATMTAAGTGTGTGTGTGGGDTGSGSPDPNVRVRTWFPETLFNEPSLITDAGGHASISLDMADSITDWRLTAMASALDGRLGSVTDAVRCFQEFFVDINLPIQLTQNDEMHVPCVIYNYLPTAQQVQVVLSNSAWFTPLGGLTQTLDLTPNEVRAVYFPIRAEDVGTQAFTVYAYGQTMNDAISRTIRVLPDGEPVAGSASGSMNPEVAADWTIPVDHIVGADDCYVKLYSGYVTQVVEGIESLLGCPHG